MSEKDLNLIFGLGVALVVSIIAWIIHTVQQGRLNDPDDDSTVYLDQLDDVALLSGDKKYSVQIFRQSGNLHKTLVCDTPEEALKEAKATFRRAKIDYVVIETNSDDFLSFRRGMHSHRGQQEGKKVGSVEIRRGTLVRSSDGGPHTFQLG